MLCPVLSPTARCRRREGTHTHLPTTPLLSSAPPSLQSGDELTFLLSLLCSCDSSCQPASIFAFGAKKAPAAAAPAAVKVHTYITAAT
jgi:hypothetical protein